MQNELDEEIQKIVHDFEEKLKKKDGEILKVNTQIFFASATGKMCYFLTA